MMRALPTEAQDPENSISSSQATRVRLPSAVGCMLVLGALLSAGFIILHDDGVVGQTEKPLRAPVLAAKGCFCHNDSASSTVHVWIAGPETLIEGSLALFSISVAKDSSVAAGFDVATFLGDLGVFDSATTQLMRIDPNNPVDSLELTHVAPKLAAGHDTVSWRFYYQAPPSGGLIDTIYAVGNSVDLSGDPSGDRWGFAQRFLVHVEHSSAVREEAEVSSFALFQNYPNPFNPTTEVGWQMAEGGLVTIKVYDLLGREITTLVDEKMGPGSHEAEFSGSKLASGLYLYRLVVELSGSRSYFATKKMLLVK